MWSCWTVTVCCKVVCILKICSVLVDRNACIQHVGQFWQINDMCLTHVCAAIFTWFIFTHGCDVGCTLSNIVMTLASMGWMPKRHWAQSSRLLCKWASSKSSLAGTSPQWSPRLVVTLWQAALIAANSRDDELRSLMNDARNCLVVSISLSDVWAAKVAVR